MIHSRGWFRRSIKVSTRLGEPHRVAGRQAPGSAPADREGIAVESLALRKVRSSSTRPALKRTKRGRGRIDQITDPSSSTNPHRPIHMVRGDGGGSKLLHCPLTRRKTVDTPMILWPGHGSSESAPPKRP